MQKSPEEIYDLVCQLMEKIDGLGTRLERYEGGLKPEEIDAFVEKSRKLVEDFERVQHFVDREGIKKEIEHVRRDIAYIESRLGEIGNALFDFHIDNRE